jgi:hypothetical protein
MSYCTTESGNFTQSRLSQMKNYQFQRYQFLSSSMTRFSYMLTYLIILLILRNSGVMADTIFGWLFVPVFAYLCIDMLYTWYSYSRRGAINFDTYIWTFNKNNANGVVPGTSGGSSGGIGDQITATVQCTNASCCQSGMAWDSTIGKCTLLS